MSEAYLIGNAMEFFHDPGTGPKGPYGGFDLRPEKGPGSQGYQKRLKDWKMQMQIEYQRRLEKGTAAKARKEKLEDIESKRKFEFEYQAKAKEPYRYDPTEREEMAAPVLAGQERALEAFAGPEEIYKQMLAEGDPMSEAVQAQLFEKGRVGIEAGTMAEKEKLAQHFRRGAPGGAAMRMMADIGEAGIGQQTALKRDIGLEATLGKRKRMLELMESGVGLAGAKAGIVERTGATLASLYRTTPTRKFT